MSVDNTNSGAAYFNHLDYIGQYVAKPLVKFEGDEKAADDEVAFINARAEAYRQRMQTLLKMCKEHSIIMANQQMSHPPQVPPYGQIIRTVAEDSQAEIPKVKRIKRQAATLHLLNPE